MNIPAFVSANKGNRDALLHILAVLSAHSVTSKLPSAQAFFAEMTREFSEALLTNEVNLKDET